MKFNFSKQHRRSSGLATFEADRAAGSQLQNGGFSTLEMLIAMSILILTLTSVTMTSFGNQSVLVDSQLDAEALNRAQALLENAQTLARKDFNLVNPTTTTETLGGITYQKHVDVSQTDLFTKAITATVGWAGEHGRSLSVDLTTLVTNFDNAKGGSTCSSVLPTHGWDTPLTLNAITDFRQLIATSTGINVITSVDAYKGKLYVTVGDTTYKTDPTFFIFDIPKLKTDPLNSLLGKFDPATTTVKGLYAVAVSDGANTGSMYAYVANEFGANWGTCSQYYNCAQLDVVDVSDPAKISTTTTAYLKIPGVLDSGGAGVGDSIFYKNGIVYLGLTNTTGKEFHTIDVHDPMHPQYLGGYEVGATVNAITVSGNYAYLATNDNSRELIVLDVSNPNTPVLATSYNAAGGGGFGYGLSLAKVGDTIDLGRTYISSAPEFLMLDASSSATVIPDPPLGSRDVGVVASPFSIDAIVVRDYLTFLAGGSPSAGGKLYIERTTPTNSIIDWAPPLTLPSGSLGSALDCEGNDLFLSSNDTSNQGYLSVITSAP